MEAAACLARVDRWCRRGEDPGEGFSCIAFCLCAVTSLNKIRETFLFCRFFLSFVGFWRRRRVFRRSFCGLLGFAPLPRRGPKNMAAREGWGEAEDEGASSSARHRHQNQQQHQEHQYHQQHHQPHSQQHQQQHHQQHASPIRPPPIYLEPSDFSGTSPQRTGAVPSWLAGRLEDHGGGGGGGGGIGFAGVGAEAMLEALEPPSGSGAEMVGVYDDDEGVGKYGNGDRRGGRHRSGGGGQASSSSAAGKANGWAVPLQFGFNALA